MKPKAPTHLDWFVHVLFRRVAPRIRRLPQCTNRSLLQVSLLVGVLFLVGCDGPFLGGSLTATTSDDVPAPYAVDIEVHATSDSDDASDGPGGSPNREEPTLGSDVRATGPPAVFLHDSLGQPLMVPDPTVYFADNGFLRAEVFSGLTRPSRSVANEIELDLASTYSVDDDGLTYTFTLRDGLKFSDGAPVTPGDVKWSWERALHPDSDSERASAVLGVIQGADELASGRSVELTGFKIVDGTAFVVELTRRHADFLWLLADPVASVLKESNAVTWATTVDWASGSFIPEFPELPVGTGPFRVAALDLLADKVALEPNPHYWDTEAELDGVQYVITDSDDRIGTWVRGEVDNSIAPNELCDHYDGPGSVTTDGIPVRVLHSDAAPRVSYLAFNTALAPYDEVEFRRALVASASVAPPEIPFVDEPHESASGLLPPSFPGHDESSSPVTTNREDAVAALAASGYSVDADDLLLTILPDPNGLARDEFEAVVANWRNWLDLNVEFADRPPTVWLPDFRDALREGSLQMRYVLTQPRYPSPHAVLGAIPNLFGKNAQSVETEQLQRMLDQAAAEQDSVRRSALYRDIEDHMLSRALVLPMFWDEGGSCHQVQDWVTAFEVPKWGGSLFRNVVIDTEHPAYPDRAVSK